MPNSQKILRKKNGAGGIKLPGFRLDYKTVVIKIVQNWHQKKKYRSMVKESPEINPHMYGHLIFNKESMDIQWRKDSLFSTCWGN